MDLEMLFRALSDILSARYGVEVEVREKDEVEEVS